MKKVTVLFAMLVLTSVMVLGCGGKKTNEVTPEKPQEVEIAGVAFDNAFISFSHPEEWKTADFPDTKMVNLARGVMLDAFVLIKAEIDDTAKTTTDMANEFAKLVKGSPSEMATFGEIEYAKTSFNYGGIDQTMLIAKIGNNKVSITVQGTGLMEDPGVLSILNSIQYKF